MDPEIIEFLEHSNWIENVSDSDSLDQAVTAWKYLIEQPKITKSVILQTHRLLMINQDLADAQKGAFRKHNVGVYGGGKLIRSFPHHTLVNHMMTGWISQIKVPPSAHKQGTPVDRQKFLDIWIRKCHVDYESIHPFADGNGRTGRMFLNWQRVKLGLPILVIRYEERSQYYEWFPKE